MLAPRLYMILKHILLVAFNLLQQVEFFFFKEIICPLICIEIYFLGRKFQSVGIKVVVR